MYPAVPDMPSVSSATWSTAALSRQEKSLLLWRTRQAKFAKLQKLQQEQAALAALNGKLRDTQAGLHKELQAPCEMFVQSALVSSTPRNAVTGAANSSQQQYIRHIENIKGFVLTLAAGGEVLSGMYGTLCKVDNSIMAVMEKHPHSLASYEFDQLTSVYDCLFEELVPSYYTRGTHHSQFPHLPGSKLQAMQELLEDQYAMWEEFDIVPILHGYGRRHNDVPIANTDR